MTKPLITDEMMADLLESDTDDGKEVKEGVTPETNMVAPEGSPTEIETFSTVEESFEHYEDLIMQWAQEPWFYAILVPVLIWSMVWKGLALWKAARNNQPYWFVSLLLINTAGLVEIGYLRWARTERSEVRLSGKLNKRKS